MSWRCYPDELPPENIPVLITNGRSISLGRLFWPEYAHGRIWIHSDALPWEGSAIITHWQPLPALPTVPAKEGAPGDGAVAQRTGRAVHLTEGTL